ncbi:hypothetical protein KKA27_00045 [Patescibacteria group bacterium]|nr:hypothetical protein [Patescibacteria group bacterium]MBU2633545.1 hypothetical protein [Patescibacteria group bacterium]
MQIKTRWIGLSISIIFLILVVMPYSVSNYFVHNASDAKIWISCGFDVRSKFNPPIKEIAGQEREDLLQSTIFEECGLVPQKSLWA